MQIIYKKQRKNKKQEIYQNELDKALSQHDMAYRDSKDLTRRTASDKILHEKAFDIAKNEIYMMDINVDLLQCLENLG